MRRTLRRIGGPAEDGRSACRVRLQGSAPVGFGHGVHHPRTQRRQGQSPVPRGDDARRLGKPRPQGFGPDHPPGPRCRHQLRRYRRRLLRWGVRSHCRGGAGHRRPVPCGAGYQGLLTDERRSQRPWQFPAMDPRRMRQQPAAPGHRLHRPLPGPPIRRDGGHRRDPWRSQRPRSRRQGPLHR